MRLVSKFDIILAEMHRFSINGELRRYDAKTPRANLSIETSIKNFFIKKNILIKFKTIIYNI